MSLFLRPAGIPLSALGQPNGAASLDGSGKVPVTQLPNSVMEYQGTWDASTNTPTLADGVGNVGDVYLVTVAGTQDLGSGPIVFYINNYAIYTGTIWEKSGGSTLTFPLTAPDGSVISPEYSFTNDITLGWYMPVAGAIGLASGGVEILHCDPSALRVPITSRLEIGTITLAEVGAGYARLSYTADLNDLSGVLFFGTAAGGNGWQTANHAGANIEAWALRSYNGPFGSHNPSYHLLYNIDGTTGEWFINAHQSSAIVHQIAGTEVFRIDATQVAIADNLPLRLGITGPVIYDWQAYPNTVVVAADPNAVANLKGYLTISDTDGSNSLYVNTNTGGVVEAFSIRSWGVSGGVYSVFTTHLDGSNGDTWLHAATGTQIKIKVQGDEIFDFNNGAGLKSYRKLRLIDGTSADPSYTFTSDTDTGIYRSADGQVTLVSNGSNRLTAAPSNIYVHGVNTTLSMDTLGSAAVPAISIGGDTDTGIFSTADGDFNISSNGTEILRINAAGLTIKNAYTLPIVDGTAGQVLQTDGLGAVSWQTVSASVPDPLLLADGSSGAPTYSFASFPGSGMYYFAAQNYLTLSNSGGANLTVGPTEIAVRNSDLYIAKDGAANDVSVYIGNGDEGLFSPANGEIGFSSSNVERVRLQSDGVNLLNNKLTLGNSGAAWLKYSADHTTLVLNSSGSFGELAAVGGASFSANTAADGSGSWLPSISLEAGGSFALAYVAGQFFRIFEDSTAVAQIDSAGLSLPTVGEGILIKEGSDATSGVATLVAGTIVVSTTKVTASSRIQLTAQNLGTIVIPAALAVSTRTAGTSFTILSSDVTDTSDIAWLIIEPA